MSERMRCFVAHPQPRWRSAQQDEFLDQQAGHSISLLNKPSSIYLAPTLKYTHPRHSCSPPFLWQSFFSVFSVTAVCVRDSFAQTPKINRIACVTEEQQNFAVIRAFATFLCRFLIIIGRCW